jgi:hypothetical protein
MAFAAEELDDFPQTSIIAEPLFYIRPKNSPFKYYVCSFGIDYPRTLA